MPILHGTVVSPGLKYRFIIALLLVYIVYSQWRHNNDLLLVIEKAGNDLTLCQNYAESLVAKLRVVYDHKVKMEKLYISKRVASQAKSKVVERLWRLCEENLTSITGQLDQCRSGNNDQISHMRLSEKVPFDRTRGEVNALKAINSSLHEIVAKKEESIQLCNKELLQLRNSLSSCQEMIKKYVGAIPVDHYTQNETAFFDRKHKAGDSLSFNRDRDAFKPPVLLPAKVLVAKLAEKVRHLRRGEEEADKHPDDRENNDNYVNDVPNAEEKDYKEHGR